MSETQGAFKTFQQQSHGRFKPCSDERQNGFQALKLKRCKFLEPFLTSCERHCFCPKTLKHFRFKCLRQFLKFNFFYLLKPFYELLKQVSKNSPRVLLICYCFFIKIEIILTFCSKNASIYSCFEASDG